ncbi:glycerol-3-phosphate 1-O-acyltransferase PlsY [Clostridium sp. Marseille-P299]|uniref:glycerol-3-phosphate 1-O-acyltransferase PlsY n=1 Tax=Clostridium sp. Marseille-P299 TaxID=1805477 RepID=UPI00082B7595|nr:glycerol-3-phosphate 1-O-acyltransferase PlsY [Clostridium sp. Marseille-P299]
MVARILICLICGYGFGCISTGYLVGKANHVDIRKYGSGNAGTTNALRTLGWKAGALTYLGDFLKAIIPILLFRNILFADVDYAQLLGLYTGLGVVLGHNYPFWLHFKGGKGIAVTTGVMAAFDPLLIPTFIIVFVVAVAITRYVSLGSLLLSILFPIWIAIRHPGDIHMLIIGLIYAASAFYTHRANIKRLLNGTENKLGQKVKIDPNQEKQ